MTTPQSDRTHATEREEPQNTPTPVQNFEFIHRPTDPEDTTWGLHPLGWTFSNGNMTSKTYDTYTWSSWMPPLTEGQTHKRYELTIYTTSENDPRYKAREKDGYLWRAALYHWSRTSPNKNTQPLEEEIVGLPIWTYKTNTKEDLEITLQNFFNHIAGDLETLDIYTQLHGPLNPEDY